MTCIVAIKCFDKIYMGGDTLGSNYYSKKIRVDQKIFKKNDMIFGFTSSYRMGQILQYSFDIPAHPDSMDDMKYLVDIFIPQLMETYKKYNWLKTKDNVAEGGVFLLGYKENIYKIEQDFQVGISEDNYDSCGCGESYALGSLHTTELYDISPEERIKYAINAAAQYSTGVGGPIQIEVL